MTYWPGIRS